MTHPIDPATLAEDAQTAAIPTDEGQRRIAKLAQRHLDLDRDIADLEARVGEKKGERNRLATQDLPDLMAELGMAAFTLSDGSGITVESFVSASVSQENRNRDAAFQWCIDNGHGDIIKNILAIELGRDSGEEVEKLRNLLAIHDHEDDVKQVKTIHASTLKAFLKERIAAGDEVPLDLFKAFVGQVAKITPPGK